MNTAGGISVFWGRCQRDIIIYQPPAFAWTKFFLPAYQILQPTRLQTRNTHYQKQSTNSVRIGIPYTEIRMFLPFTYIVFWNNSFSSSPHGKKKIPYSETFYFRSAKQENDSEFISWLGIFQTFSRKPFWIVIILQQDVLKFCWMKNC